MADESKIEVIDDPNHSEPLTAEGKAQFAQEILEMAMRRCNPQDLAEIMLTITANLALGSGIPAPLAWILMQQHMAEVFERSANQWAQNEWDPIVGPGPSEGGAAS